MGKTSSDVRELEKFYTELWARRGEGIALAPSNQKRLSLLFEFLRQWLPKSEENQHFNVLDYGTGSGWLLPYLLENSQWIAHAYDVTPSTLEQVIIKYPSVKTWIGDTSFPTPLPDNYFDLVVSLEVLEHIPYRNQPFYFDEIRRVTKPNGLIFITTPNRKWLKATLREDERQPVEDWVTVSKLGRLAKERNLMILSLGTWYLGKFSFTDHILLSNKLKKILSKLSLLDGYENFIGTKLKRGLSIYMGCKKR